MSNVFLRPNTKVEHSCRLAALTDHHMLCGAKSLQYPRYDFFSIFNSQFSQFSQFSILKPNSQFSSSAGIFSQAVIHRKCRNLRRIRFSTTLLSLHNRIVHQRGIRRNSPRQQLKALLQVPAQPPLRDDQLSLRPIARHRNLK